MPWALYLRGSSPDYITQSQHRHIRHGLAANAGADLPARPPHPPPPEVKFCVCVCHCPKCVCGSGSFVFFFLFCFKEPVTLAGQPTAASLNYGTAISVDHVLVCICSSNTDFPSELSWPPGKKRRKEGEAVQRKASAADLLFCGFL